MFSVRVFQAEVQTLKIVLLWKRVARYDRKVKSGERDQRRDA
jgi:hypothetical protein